MTILVHGVKAEVALYSQPAQPGAWAAHSSQQAEAEPAWANSPV